MPPRKESRPFARYWARISRPVRVPEILKSADSWLILAVLAVTHCWVLNVYPYWVNPNAASRVYVAQSIVDDGSFQIDPWLTRFASIQDRALYKGHYYSDKAPGMAFWLVPWTWIGRRLGIGIDQTRRMIVFVRWLGLSIPAVLFWVLLIPLYRDAAQTYAGAKAAVLAGALGTNFYMGATQLWAHGAAGMWLFVSFAALKESGASKKYGHWLAAAGGFAASYAFITDYIVSFALPVLFGYAIYQAVGGGRRRPLLVAAFCAGGSFPLALWAWYNTKCFDSPFHLGSFYCDDPDCQNSYRSGLFGVQAPDLKAVWGMTFDSSRGMFFFSPILILGFFGWRELWRDNARRAEALVAMLACAGIFAFATTTVDWTGGWSQGTRYLIPAVPFWLVGVAGSLRLAAKRPWFGALFAGLAAVSMGVVAIGAMTFPLFPSQYVNPVFDFAWPMFLERHFSRTVADPWLGGASWIPFAGFFAAAAAMMLRYILLLLPRKAAAYAGVSFAVAAIVLAAESLVPEPLDHAIGREKMKASIVWDMGYGETP